MRIDVKRTNLPPPKAGRGEPLLERYGGSTSTSVPVQGAVRRCGDLDLPAGAAGDRSVRRHTGRASRCSTARIAGVHQPDHGEIYFEGQPCTIRSARDAGRASGIETVYQDLPLAITWISSQNMFPGPRAVAPRHRSRGQHGARRR